MAPEAEIVAEVRGFAAPNGAIDIAIRMGDVVILRGPNGAGKTSLLRLLAGLDAPLAAKSIRVSGTAPRAEPAAGLSALIHFAQQDPRDGLVGLTVAGEMRLRGQALPHDLAALGHRETTTLSSGEVRRIALAVAQAGTPPLLLLDEPSEGLDAARRTALDELVAQAATRGAVVAADHSGLLDHLATCTVELAPQEPTGAIALPEAGTRPVLEAPPVQVTREGCALDLPGVAFPSGLHAVVGPNGSGKSTLLLHWAGLLPGQRPAATIAGRRADPGANVRLLLPRARDLFCHASVRAELQGADDRIRRPLVPDHLLPAHPLAISGGEAQRVALAKTLGQSAAVYLLDEPEAHLDAAGRRDLVDAMTMRIREGACIVVATHDHALRATAHSNIVLARDGGSANP